MNCQKCNFQNESTAKFCKSCGAELIIPQPHLPDITSIKPARLWKTIAILFPAIMLVFSLIALSDVEKVLSISNVEKLVEKNVYDTVYGTKTSYSANGSPFSSFLGAEAWAYKWRFSVDSSQSLEDIAAAGLEKVVWQTHEDAMWVMVASSIQLGIVLLCLFVIWFQRNTHT